MNLDMNTTAIQTKLRPVIEGLRKYGVAITVLVIAAVFGFLIWRIGALANAEPSEAALDEKLQAVVRPRIDPDSIKVIEDLQSQNIDIKSLFSDRDNPFQE
jgi:hypothetical protein